MQSIVFFFSYKEDLGSSHTHTHTHTHTHITNLVFRMIFGKLGKNGVCVCVCVCVGGWVGVCVCVCVSMRGNHLYKVRLIKITQH